MPGMGVTPDQPTPLWTARRGASEVRILARLLPGGLEVGVEMGDSLLHTFMFQTENELQAWVREKRAELEAEGWWELPSDE